MLSRRHILFNGAFNCMMTSSNGNTFRVTGLLCGEFTGPRWIPRTKASDAGLWCFLWSRINGWVNNREAGDLRRRCANYDVIVMGWNRTVLIFVLPLVLTMESKCIILLDFAYYICCLSVSAWRISVCTEMMALLHSLSDKTDGW